MVATIELLIVMNIVGVRHSAILCYMCAQMLQKSMQIYTRIESIFALKLCRSLFISAWKRGHLETEMLASIIGTAPTL